MSIDEEKAGRYLDEIRSLHSNNDVPKQDTKPRPAHIRCPWCATRHLDVGEWETRPHHKHLCAACKRLFRVEGADGEYFFGIPDDDDHYAGAGHDRPAPADTSKRQLVPERSNCAYPGCTNEPDPRWFIRIQGVAWPACDGHGGMDFDGE